MRYLPKSCYEIEPLMSQTLELHPKIEILIEFLEILSLDFAYLCRRITLNFGFWELSCISCQDIRFFGLH